MLILFFLENCRFLRWVAYRAEVFLTFVVGNFTLFAARLWLTAHPVSWPPPLPTKPYGFAGARVIEQTIRETLPEGFQRSEFQKEHGFVDRIVERRNMREELGKILRLHESVRKGETGPGQEASRN